MLRGIYAAAAGMVTQRERLDVIANNMANVSTIAFKRAEPVSRGFYQVFAEEVVRFPPLRGSREVPGGGSALDATPDDFSPGAVVETGNQLDIAIDGLGFFVIRTPTGERYTRAGKFSLDSGGQLVTQNGHPVLGKQGPILIRGETVQISPEGDVLVDGAPAERIVVVDFPRPYRLSKYGQNLYGASEEVRQTRSTVAAPHLRVGALERSNVNTVAELTLLMDAARSYEAHQRVIQAFDESLDSAVNEIARA
ncbi:MAG: flagellar hook-basal body protein [Candidatus Hydrogenedentota bacterium]|nr:MAG: flagellar hook-basal body protein [Candidatus Hydrogenedentota bacterium]